MEFADVIVIDDEEYDDESDNVSVRSGTINELDARLNAALEATRQWRLKAPILVSLDAPAKNDLRLENEMVELELECRPTLRSTSANPEKFLNFLATLGDLIGFESIGEISVEYKMHRITEIIKTNIEDRIYRDSLIETLQNQVSFLIKSPP